MFSLEDDQSTSPSGRLIGILNARASLLPITVVPSFPSVAIVFVFDLPVMSRCLKTRTACGVKGAPRACKYSTVRRLDIHRRIYSGYIQNLRHDSEDIVNIHDHSQKILKYNFEY